MSEETMTAEDRKHRAWMRMMGVNPTPDQVRVDRLAHEAEATLDDLRERGTCSQCLARTYRDEECICPDGGDAEDVRDEFAAAMMDAEPTFDGPNCERCHVQPAATCEC